jgi:hypothetical protein
MMIPALLLLYITRLVIVTKNVGVATRDLGLTSGMETSFLPKGTKPAARTQKLKAEYRSDQNKARKRR